MSGRTPGHGRPSAAPGAEPCPRNGPAVARPRAPAAPRTGALDGGASGAPPVDLARNGWARNGWARGAGGAPGAARRGAGPALAAALAVGLATAGASAGPAPAVPAGPQAPAEAPAAGAATLPMDVPALHEEAAAAGLSHVYGGPWEYFVGGGAAAFDCDGDRRPDLALAGGANPAGVWVNRAAAGGPLRFQPVLDALPEAARARVTGFYPLDIDGDGWRDLVALRVGEDLLLKGGPGCRFTVANRAWGFDGGRAWTTAFAATWEQGARFPTLAFGAYVDRSAPGAPWGTCHDNLLIRPGPGETPDYAAPQTLSPGHCALSMLFTDWDRSGAPALRVTNDRHYHRGGEEQLWRLDPGRPARPFRAADGWRRLVIWGMGVAEADLDADGTPEYALTSMGDTKLQTLDPDAEPGRPTYRDAAWERGVTAHRPYAGGDLRPSTGWHAEFADFNNDGRLDLFIAKGNVENMPDFAALDPDNLLLMGHDGVFAEAGDRAGIALDRRGRGAAAADFNMDGMLDLVVVNREGPASLFRNLGAAAPGGDGAAAPGGDGAAAPGALRPLGGWVQVALEQPGPNRDAVGAQLLVKSGNATRARRVQVGGGHASGRLGWVHVGLGVAERAEIRVQWPDGAWSAPYRVFAGGFVVLRRDAPEALQWFPPAD